jgi:DNA replication protein DnaC
MSTVYKHLREFKLSGMVANIDERIAFANDKQLGYLEFIELLCDDEINNRNRNGYKKRLTKARIPSHKTLEDFDFSFQPSINKKQVNDIYTCQFIRENKNAVFIGKPGTGKTHLAIAIGLHAIAKGFKVLFTDVGEMLDNLHMAKADNSYYKKLQDYINPDLLILDELGFKALPAYSAQDFFDVIAKRYEKGACIVTTNKNFENWGEIFTDNIMASAILDRIVHHSSIFKINGPSYRAKNIQEDKNMS